MAVNPAAEAHGARTDPLAEEIAAHVTRLPVPQVSARQKVETGPGQPGTRSARLGTPPGDSASIGAAASDPRPWYGTAPLLSLSQSGSTTPPIYTSSSPPTLQTRLRSSSEPLPAARGVRQRHRNGPIDLTGTGEPRDEEDVLDE